MFQFIMGAGMFVKAGIGSMLTSVVGSLTTYASAGYLFAKPIVIYMSMRFTWLLGIATIEWWSGRLYSINCIGEGMGGFYNHIFQIASPACTGLLTTHIGLMGVLVATFMITCLWGLYNIFNHIKMSVPGKNVINEYNDVKGMFNVDQTKRYNTTRRNRSNSPSYSSNSRYY